MVDRIDQKIFLNSQISIALIIDTGMQAQKNIYKSPQLILDADGYVKSFDLNTCTQQELAQFYHDYGFVVFRDIVSQQETDKTIDAIWESTINYTKQVYGSEISRDNPETWSFIKGFQKTYGFVGDGILQELQFWLNRKNPKVYQAFKKTYQASTGKLLNEPLLACLDRGSMMLPGGLKQEWVSKNLYHFDIDPWAWTETGPNFHRKYNYEPQTNFYMLGEGNYDKNVGYTKLAGVLALSDTNEESGGFECACGFQNYIKQWCLENKRNTHIQDDKNLVDNFKKVFMRKGSLLVFSRQLPHNIYQNKSKNFRYAQYLRMAPLSALILNKQLVKRRQDLLKMLLPKDLDVSDEISQEVFMLNLNIKEAIKRGLVQK